VPITSLRLKNFKCFADSGVIPLSPLTVIFGRNNVGKSSILQGLMALRQTYDSAEYEARLNLRGPLFRGGTYADVVHDHKARAKLAIEVGVTREDDRTASLAFEYSSDEPRPPRLSSFRLSAPSHAPIRISRGQGAGGPFEMYIGGTRMGGTKSANFSFPVHGLLPVIGEEPPRVGRPSERRASSREHARSTFGYVEQCLESMRVMGAFRRAPERRYDYGGYIRESLDIEGRTVVDALIDDATRRGKSKGELFSQVNKWLGEVGRVALLPIHPLAPDTRVYELRLRDLRSGRWANFADLGSGIGQAFPVIVEGLRTPPGGMFLVQEPEIHLHPDAQLAMADFLIALVNSGRRVIAETHSEALLLRIRRRIVEATHRRAELGHEDLSVLIVEQAERGPSRVRHVSIDDLGQLTGWPSGFYEDTTKERLELMTSMARDEAE
jgi:AAA ATPase domain